MAPLEQVLALEATSAAASALTRLQVLMARPTISNRCHRFSSSSSSSGVPRDLLGPLLRHLRLLHRPRMIPSQTTRRRATRTSLTRSRRMQSRRRRGSTALGRRLPPFAAAQLLRLRAQAPEASGRQAARGIGLTLNKHWRLSGVVYLHSLSVAL